jgi:hypothetical protein
VQASLNHTRPDATTTSPVTEPLWCHPQISAHRHQRAVGIIEGVAEKQGRFRLDGEKYESGQS